MQVAITWRQRDNEVDVDCLSSDHLYIRPEPYREIGQPDHAGGVAGKSNEFRLVKILGNISE